MALATLSQFSLDSLTPHSLPPSLLTLLAVDPEQCDTEQTLTREQLVMAALSSSAGVDGVSSMLVAVLRSELPPPRGVVFNAVQNAQALSAMEQEINTTWRHLRGSLSSSTEDPLGVAAVAELITGARSLRSQTGPGDSLLLQEVWHRALTCFESTPLLSANGFEWSTLAGLSLLETVIRFTTALLVCQLEVSEEWCL